MNSKPAIQEHHRNGFTVSTERSRLDVDFIHDFLAQKSYWAAEVPREVVERSLRNSLCFGLYQGCKQIGLARVVTDYATFAYVCDVFVDAAHRRSGLGTWLMECVMAQPSLPELRRIMLATKDAHELYRRFGFAELVQPQKLMEIHRPNVYQKARN
jgi:GNAT superfamily N-acetyltransferase